MLSSVLDTKMTQKIVRLGSRSADERISQFSIENMEMVQGKSRLDRNFGHHHRELKDVEEEVKTLMNDFLKVDIDSSRIVQYLELHYPEHHEYIINPPTWISTIKSINSDERGEGWKQVGKRGRGQDMDNSMYAHWRSGRDLDFVDGLGQQILSPKPDPGVGPVGHSQSNKFSVLADPETASQQDNGVIVPGDDENDTSEDSDEDAAEERWTKVPFDQQSNTPAEPALESSSVDVSSSSRFVKTNPPLHFIQPSDLRDPADFFFAHGCDSVPVVPNSDRALDVLLEFGDIWSMSRSERHRLHGFWIELVRTDLHDNQLEDFERLRRKHADKLGTYNEGKDEVGKSSSTLSRANCLRMAGTASTTSKCRHNWLHYYGYVDPLFTLS